MRNLLRISSLMFAFGLSVTTHPLAQQTGDQRTLEIFADRIGESAKDLPERMTQVDAVIRCRIAASQTNTAQRKPSIGMTSVPDDLPPDVFTESTVNLLEIIKSNPQLPAVGGAVQVVQPFGTTTWKGHKLVKKDGSAKIFNHGEEYVLFLNWNPNTNVFFVIADDTFRIVAGHVESPSEAKYAVLSKGLAAPEFISAVRAAVKPSR
jgi:hypothetical protein